MKAYNTVSVTVVRSIESGDLIAYSFGGRLWGGEVITSAYSGHDLSEELRSYMQSKQLDLPPDPHQALGGDQQVLVFVRSYPDRKIDHLYLDFDDVVAVFPKG